MSRAEVAEVICTECSNRMVPSFGKEYPHRLDGWGCACGNSVGAVIEDGMWKPEQDDACPS